MNLVYGALLLHSAGKEINEKNVKKIAEATGEKVEEAQVKALVVALEGVNIADVISKAVMPVATPAPVEVKEEKKEEKPEEKEKKAEEAAEGLSALFG